MRREKIQEEKPMKNYEEKSQERKSEIFLLNIGINAISVYIQMHTWEILNETQSAIYIWK